MAELSSNDIRHLINDYEAQIRRLQFELEQAKLTVRSLKESLSSVLEKEKTEAAAALNTVADAQQAALEISDTPKRKGRRGRGRPRSQQAVAKAVNSDSKKTAKKKGRKKTATRRTYRPSEYDQYLFDCLQERGKATITSEFVSFAMDRKRAAGEEVTEDQVATMVARSLQKLANRRSDLLKVPYEGRGKAYVLPDWMRGGKLKAKHSRS
jgi:ParB-like chromosome segregation protein Spo0J